MATYLTSGQVARKLRISVSTLKRWLVDPELSIAERRNCNGWRLFTERDIDALRKHKRRLKRNGKRFNETTLIPIAATVTNQLQARQNV
ncbi:MAG: MerR family transcriptional regulator [Chitinivibrionales bacterium]|nr:MerR family transcriptional regulator [Chitinivibrionales bacterium]MBD3397236.1 MerR family transcriptional regulator [Chitinivibrionales bacterium]